LKINFYLNRIQYKFILICFLSIVTLDAEEISAFGAGDLSSPNPYGLTSVEESVLRIKINQINLIQILKQLIIY
jgi:hypothetical protein